MREKKQRTGPGLRRLSQVLLLSGATLLAGCNTGPAQPPAGRLPLVIGHAGSGFLTPINPFNPLPPSSYASIRLALDRGADGVEIDLQLSQDSVPIVYHNQELESMSTGQGCVYEQPAATLLRLRYKAGWWYDFWQQERLMALPALLDSLRRRPGPRPYLHLDLHETNACNPRRPLGRAPALARALARTLQAAGWPAERLLVVTMNPSSVAALRRAMPNVPLALEITDDFERKLRLAQQNQVQAVVIRKDLITPENTRQARAAGLQVVAFGGRSRRTVQRLLLCQPDAIEVDNVLTMQALLGRTY